MHIAYITDEIPRPNRAGYLTYTHALVTTLAARGHMVTIVLGWPRLGAPVVRFGGRLDRRRVRVVGNGVASFAGIAVLTHPRRLVRALARFAMGLMPGWIGEGLRRHGRSVAYGLVDAVIGRFLTDAEARAAAAIAERADIVVADTIFRAPALAFLSPGKPSAVITHDVFSARHAALTALGLNLHPPSLTESDEAALLRRADLVVAIQDREREVLARLVPGVPIVTAPMPATLVPRPAGVAREAGRLVYVGSLGPHNVDGMRWLIAEVWPRLRTALPGVRLDVAGTIGRALGEVPDGIRLLGVVKDLSPLLHRASLAVAPLRAGSGQATKLLDFAAHGLTTVTTSQGLAGYPADPAWPFAVADTAEAFAAAIARLAATDGADREPSAAAYLRHFEPDVVLAPFAAALERLAERGGRRADAATADGAAGPATDGAVPALPASAAAEGQRL